MKPTRDYGSTEPFADPYTPAQHADITLGAAAARMSDALDKAARDWTRALGASLLGDETSAAGFRADALAALHAYRSLQAEVRCAQPIRSHDDAAAMLQHARDLIERVRNSTLPGTARDGHLSVAMGAIDNDLDALEKGE
jgi:hypothetical protein